MIPEKLRNIPKKVKPASKTHRTLEQLRTEDLMYPWGDPQPGNNNSRNPEVSRHGSKWHLPLPGPLRRR